MSVQLAAVVPWGRSLREYELMFALTPSDLGGRLLDCGGGPSSFNAEATTRGAAVCSFDPLYALPGRDIERRFQETLDDVIGQVVRTPANWVWTCHRGPEDLRNNRIAVMRAFLADYEAGRAAGRYTVAALPVLPFADDRFDLAVCSHFLFLYSDLFSFHFHLASAREILRVARELRVFPLLTLGQDRSPHVEPLAAALTADGHDVAIERVAYELQRGGNEMMRIRRPSA